MLESVLLMIFKDVNVQDEFCVWTLFITSLSKRTKFKTGAELLEYNRKFVGDDQNPKFDVFVIMLFLKTRLLKFDDDDLFDSSSTSDAVRRTRRNNTLDLPASMNPNCMELFEISIKEILLKLLVKIANCITIFHQYVPVGKSTFSTDSK